MRIAAVSAGAAMERPAAMSELTDFLRVIDAAGGESALLADPHTASLVADAHHLLKLQGAPGVDVQARAEPDAIIADVTVRRDARAERPIHLCFGLLQPVGTQHISMRIRIEEDAEATFLAHCLFAEAQEAQHTMDADITLDPGAKVKFSEGHYHGPFGGITVSPKARIRVGPHAQFTSDFSLLRGRVGTLDVDFRVEVGAHGLAELTSRVLGRGSDQIRIREEVLLAGEGARSLVKARVALEDDAVAEITGITDGHAPGARGHLDCREIIRDRAVGRSIPIVRVSHPEAKVTHEAAIGSIDRDQLETLVAHGLTPDAAVDTVIRGMLR